MSGAATPPPPIQQGSWGKLPASIAKFVGDIAKFLVPSLSGKGPDVVKRVNASLTGQNAKGGTSLLGWVAKIGLSVGFIFAVTKIAKNWISNNQIKNETQTYNAASEALVYEQEAIRLRTERQYMLETGQHPQHLQNESQHHSHHVPYGQYDMNPNARTDNALRLQQREAAALQYANENHR